MTMREILAKAKAAGACSEAIDALSGLTKAEAKKHQRAAEWAYWYARNVVKGKFPEEASHE